MNHPKQLIDKKELVKLVKYSPQHIARLEKAGTFPKKTKLGRNRVAWLLSEVEDWIDERFLNVMPIWLAIKALLSERARRIVSDGGLPFIKR